MIKENHTVNQQRYKRINQMDMKGLRNNITQINQQLYSEDESFDCKHIFRQYGIPTPEEDGTNFSPKTIDVLTKFLILGNETKKIFKIIDANSDGLISKEELKQMKLLVED